MQKKIPSTIRFLLADNITEQVGGKLLVVGLYSGDAVVLQGALPAEVPAEFNGIALPGLYILATFIDGVGEFELSINIRDPNGKELGQRPSPPVKVNLVEGKSQNLILPIIPFPIIAFGKYRIELRIHKKNFKYEFSVQHEDPNTALPVIQSKKKAIKKPIKKVASSARNSHKQT